MGSKANLQRIDGLPQRVAVPLHLGPVDDHRGLGYIVDVLPEEEPFELILARSGSLRNSHLGEIEDDDEKSRLPNAE